MYICVRGINDAYFCDKDFEILQLLYFFSILWVTFIKFVCFYSVFSVVLGAITYRPIGCIHGGGIHPLPTLLHNFRGNIDWYNIQLTVEQCVTAASSSGFPYFGIEFWGECWVSNTFDITPFSLVLGSECETNCYSGIADSNKQFIYEILWTQSEIVFQC